MFLWRFVVPAFDEIEIADEMASVATKPRPSAPVPQVRDDALPHAISTPQPSRGRPRSVTADAMIHDAVIDELARGYGSLTIKAVARRAGVARTTIYRRYPTKAALVTESLRSTVARPTTPETNDPFQDIRVMLKDVLTSIIAHPQRFAAIQSLFLAATFDAEAADVVQTIGMPLFRVVVDRLETAQRASLLPEGCDIEAAADLLLGFLPFRIMIRRGAIDEGVTDRMCDLFFGSVSQLTTTR